jgi:hypothetical protein
MKSFAFVRAERACGLPLGPPGEFATPSHRRGRAPSCELVAIGGDLGRFDGRPTTRPGTRSRSACSPAGDAAVYASGLLQNFPRCQICWEGHNSKCSGRLRGFETARLSGSGGAVGFPPIRQQPAGIDPALK